MLRTTPTIAFYGNVVADALSVVSGLGLIAKGVKVGVWAYRFARAERLAEAGGSVLRVLNAGRQLRAARGLRNIAAAGLAVTEAYGTDVTVWTSAVNDEAPSWKDFVPIWASIRAHDAMERACR